MKTSELIAKLQAFLARHGDLYVQAAVPEGPYTRLEEGFAILGKGYCDDEGNYYTNKREAGSECCGPFLCIGAEGY